MKKIILCLWKVFFLFILLFVCRNKLFDILNDIFNKGIEVLDEHVDTIQKYAIPYIDKKEKKLKESLLKLSAVEEANVYYDNFFMLGLCWKVELILKDGTNILFDGVKSNMSFINCKSSGGYIRRINDMEFDNWDNTENAFILVLPVYYLSIFMGKKLSSIPLILENFSEICDVINSWDLSSFWYREHDINLPFRISPPSSSGYKKTWWGLEFVLFRNPKGDTLYIEKKKVRNL